MPTGRQIVRMNASKVKNQMGEVLDRVMQGQFVVITKHETPKAAVIPIQEFEKLTKPQGPELRALSRKYDKMLARMQTPEARRRMKAAFEASPRMLAKAALKRARKRG